MRSGTGYLMNPSSSEFLQPTAIIDYHHPVVAEFSHKHTQGVLDPKERAIKLYYAVRDGIRYDPYAIDLSIAGMRASTTLNNGYGWCVPKAALLAACWRCIGLPAKLGYADVKNHLSTARLRAIMKTDIFCWHGYTSIQLDHKWVKATPAFNIELCERFHLIPLDFDGNSDSIYHPFDQLGNKHMEYVRQRGEFSDVPLAEISADFRRYFPDHPNLERFDFDKDVDLEPTAEK